MKSSSSSTGSWKKWLPGVLISLVALFVVFRVAEWEDLGPALKTFSLKYILAIIGLTILFLLIRGVAWRVILGGKTSVSRAFWLINAGYLLNNLFPFRAGEIGRAVLMGQATGLGPVHVLSTVVIERAFDMAFAAGLLLATLPLALGMAWAKTVAMITLGLVIGGLAALFLIARYHEAVNRFIDKLGERWGFVRKFVGPQLHHLIEGLSVLTNLRQFLTALFWIALSWVVAVSQYYVMLLAINPQAPVWWGAFTDGVLALGIAIPSAPAALGTFEAAIVGALKVLGINETQGLAYAITIHFMQFLVTGVLGLIALLRQGRSLGNLFKDLRVRNTAQ